MYKLTKQEWAKIHKDYKTDTRAGKKVFAGSLPDRLKDQARKAKDTGTILVPVEIVKQLDEGVDDFAVDTPKMKKWVKNKINTLSKSNTPEDKKLLKKYQHILKLLSEETHGISEEQAILEKAKSEIQQQAAGAALAVKRGEASPSTLFGASKRMYDDMTEKELEDFAGTKHDPIPHKVQEGFYHGVQNTPEKKVAAQPKLLSKIAKVKASKNLGADEVYDELHKLLKGTLSKKEADSFIKGLDEIHEGVKQKLKHGEWMIQYRKLGGKPDQMAQHHFHSGLSPSEAAKKEGVIKEVKVLPSHKKEFERWIIEIMKNIKADPKYSKSLSLEKDQESVLRASMLRIIGIMGQPNSAAANKLKPILPKSWDETLVSNGNNNTYESVWWSMTDAQRDTIVKKGLQKVNIKEEISRVLEMAGVPCDDEDEVDEGIGDTVKKGIGKITGSEKRKREREEEKRRSEMFKSDNDMRARQDAAAVKAREKEQLAKKREKLQKDREKLDK